MPEQRRNSAMISTLGGEFQRRYEAAFAWKSACSAFLALPGLRGFWPMSSFASGGDAYDQSGNGRTLAYNGNPTYNYDALAPYIHFDGTGDWLSRADEGGLDIQGNETYVAPAAQGLTLGGWFYFDDAAGAAEGLSSKWRNVAGERAYLLERQVAGTVSFFIRNAADTLTNSAASMVAPAQSTWFFCAGTFDPSTNVAVWINDNEVAQATAFGALNNSAEAFAIGAWATSVGGSSLLTGRASLCFLCTAFLSDAIILSLYHQTRPLFGV